MSKIFFDKQFNETDIIKIIAELKLLPNEYYESINQKIHILIEYLSNTYLMRFNRKRQK